MPMKTKLMLAWPPAVGVVVRGVSMTMASSRQRRPGCSPTCPTSGKAPSSPSSTRWRTLPARRSGAAILVPASSSARRALAGCRRPAQGLGGRLRADGRRALRPDAVPGTHDRPARVEGELTRSHHRAGRGAERPRATGAAQPERFFREQQKPTASVMLTLTPGRTLDRAADRRHRAPGVVQRAREMNPKAVSVLARPARCSPAIRPTAGQASRSSCVRGAGRSGYQKRIFELLGRWSATTCAPPSPPTSTSQSEATAEEFSPNQGERTPRWRPAASRNRAASRPRLRACPARFNQPPVPATAPVSGSPGAAGRRSGGNGNNRRDARPTTRSTRPCA